METISLKLEGDQKELVVRTGDALPLKEPKKLDISGSITAPMDFMSVIKPDAEKDVVTYSLNDLRITYQKNFGSAYSDTIEGKLKLNPDLQKFKINTGSTWTLKELASLFKMNRLFFVDRDECNLLVEKLNKFKAFISVDLEKNKDDRGNNKQLIDKKVNTDIPEKFKLCLPVFLGQPKVEFYVELCFDTTESSVSIWLESAELQEIIINQRDRLIIDEIDKIEALGLIAIEQ